VTCETGDYWLTRLVFQRTLGIGYLVAFICALNQFVPLLGEHGLLPVSVFVRRAGFHDSPSLFFAAPHDWAFRTAAWLGIALSLAVVFGLADRYSSLVNGLIWAGLWVLYISFVNVGQIFYGFGWESILLEAGFFAAFLGARSVKTPVLIIYLLRWLEFRVMFGAGLIKLRGDSCWRDLTCLDYHYETQPMPNSLSWYFHFAPEWTHKAGVLFNHFAELLVPFCYFLPQPIASVAGLITIAFQLMIFASGNLSWLNFLTMVLAIPAIDGRWLAAVIPIPQVETTAASTLFKSAAVSLTALICLMSIAPVRNLLSPNQVMNTSFNAIHLVGTYGAFGGITRRRMEIQVEGTSDSVITAETKWKAYEFRGKPSDLQRAPPQIAPYHLRLDWLMWFAAMSGYEEHPWFINLVAKLLHNDPPVLSLIRSNPFPDQPPKWVRARRFEYRFVTPEERKRTGQWWARSEADLWFPAISLENASLQRVLREQGWE
jgi:hypothetical protein